MRAARVTVTECHFAYARSASILRGVSLAVQPGEFLCVLGPSGGGKSTLLRLIAGLERPTAGRVLINGADAHSVPPAARRIGFVFQRDNLYAGRSVRFNIGYALQNDGVPRESIDARVQNIAAALRISDLLDRTPSQLSGGQAQRVAIARALAREPDLFLLDEPLSSLDPPLRRALQEELALRHLANPTATVLVTHDPAEALSLADSIAVLIDGTVRQHDRPDRLLRKPATLEVARTLSQTHLNELSATASAGEVHVPDLDVRLPFCGKDGALILLVPPSRLVFTSAGARASIASVRTDNGGAHMRLVNSRGTSILVATAGPAPDVGATVCLSLSGGEYNAYSLATGSWAGTVGKSGHG